MTTAVLPILILAAGQSSRMRGADKLLLPIDGIPLLRRQVLLALGFCDYVLVALPPGDTLRAGTIRDLDVSILVVASAAEGMSATLRDGVAALPDCQRFMVLPGDLATIEPTDLRAVARAADAFADALIWRGATSDGKPGHPIVFDAELRPRFASLEGDTGGEAIVRPLIHRTHLVRLPGRHARHDLDTPEDWAAFRAETGR